MRAGIDHGTRLSARECFVSNAHRGCWDAETCMKLDARQERSIELAGRVPAGQVRGMDRRVP